VLTVQWRVPHVPDEHERWRLDLLARQAADAIEAKRADDALRGLNDTLEARVAERTVVAEQRAAQLRELVGQLVTAEGNERERIARLLHDDLQQVLVAARIHVDLLRADAEGTPAASTLDRVAEMLGLALRSSRGLTSELAPPVPGEGGLPASLAWLADDGERKHGLCVTLHVDDAVRVDEPLRTLFFQAARELLLNVVKHAGVDRATVTLEHDAAGWVQLTVADAGRGFDPAAMRHPTPGAAKGFGLFSIQERLHLVGGELRLLSAPGSGTRAVVLGPPPESLPAKIRAAAADESRRPPHT
jgi:signal transduction histidine kinase